MAASKQSTSSFFVTAAAVTVAVAAAAVYTQRRLRRRRRSGGDNSKGKKLDFKDGSQESLVDERFQACVHVLGPQLPRLPQRTQLDYYGLFKQGSLGDCVDFQPSPPPSYDLVATAKYQAWARLAGMDRMTAMQNYIDKAIHFQFTKHLEDNDDHDYELEGDPALDVWGLGDKPSTMADEYDKDALALEDSKYPIHAAAREGKLEELQKLIEESSSSSTTSADSSSNPFPNTRDESGQTPLHLATDRGHIECVKALILAGADVNSVDNDGISILQAAVIGGDKDCTQLLLVLGANPDQSDNDGDTPRGSAQDDAELKELFQSHDDKTLTLEDIIDSDFLKQLQKRDIYITFPPKIPSDSGSEPKTSTDAGSEPKMSVDEGSEPKIPTDSGKKLNKVDVKREMKILDEPIDIDMDDDGDMF